MVFTISNYLYIICLISPLQEGFDDEKGLKKMIITKAVARVLATLTGREDILEKMKGDGGTVEMYSFWKDAEKSGIEKGKQQGKLSVVLKLLEKLLGKLKPDLEMKIVNSKEETLDSIIIHIFEIHNEEDVLKYIYKQEKYKMKQRKKNS